MDTITEVNNDLLQRKITSLRDALLESSDELTLLYSLIAQLGRLMNADEIGATALAEAMEIIEADCGWVVLWDSGEGSVPASCRTGITDEAAAWANRALLAPARVRGKGYLLSNEVSLDWPQAHPPALGRLLACEMRANDVAEGFLCLGRSSSREIFTSADYKLAYAIATVTGMMLGNVRLQRSQIEKQRLTHQLELARQIQRSLLPRDFQCCPFIEAAGASFPCHEIGGDYFDLMPISQGRCLLVIADVCGKGPAAALQAALVQGVMHSSCHHTSDLGQLVRAANHCFHERAAEGSFVTAFLGSLDSRGELVYTNAGHNPPLWIRTGGEVIELTEGGLVFGVVDGYPYKEATVQMAPGDLLLLFTDGVTDAENPQGECFGAGRLKQWAAAQKGKTAAEVQADLIRKTSDFAQDRRQFDDLTFLAVRYTG